MSLHHWDGGQTFELAHTFDWYLYWKIRLSEPFRNVATEPMAGVMLRIYMTSGKVSLLTRSWLNKRTCQNIHLKSMPPPTDELIYVAVLLGC